jgi:hypothetical protein
MAGMDKLMKDLLKEAHDHGFAIALSSIHWDIGKSWTEFLKQNNIPLITEDEIRDQVAKKAIQLRSQGHSLRNIASILGYTHPQSIKNIMMWYEKRQKKRNKKEDQHE